MTRLASSRTASALLLIAIVALGAGSAARLAGAQQPAGGELDVVEVRPGFYMIAGAGGNIAAQVGPIGVILVDTGAAPMADKVLAAVKRLSNQPIRYIINTSADADHTGGNEQLSKAGQTILGSQGSAGVSEEAYTSGGAASVLAHENVLARMSAPSAPQPKAPSAVWPTKVYSGKSYPMSLNGDGIQVLYAPAAHSDGDSIVFFRRADVIVTGDTLDTTRFPVIDTAKGGSIQGELDALTRLVDLTIPPFPLAFREERTYLVPGHGFVCDYADLVEYRRMVTIVRDRIRELAGTGMTLPQVKAADPVQGFRTRYGADTGSWTTDMFVDAVYKTLAKR